jgi:hypothetical protein
MPEKPFFQTLGIGVSSLTFGVALSIFIYAAISGTLISAQSFLLFIATFLLMLRFWWRYNELFVQHLPSKTFWHFLFDFAISFFGIIAILLINNIQTWAAVGMAAMAASIIRCGLSWHDAKDKIKDKSVFAALKRTKTGSAFMFIIMLAVYLLAFFIEHLVLSAAIFVLVILFIIYSSRKA